MSRRVVYAEEKQLLEETDPAPRGERLAPMRGRHDEVWFGGGQGSRTPDPYVANVVLSQLS